MMLRRVARRCPLRSVVTKTSTGIVGLEVDVNARQHLIDQCEALLEALKPIPEWSGYRIDVEKIVKYRLDVAKTNENEIDIENIIGQGQLEELLDHGNDEFKVIDMYIENKVWEAVKDQEFIASVIEEGPPSEDEEPPPEEKNA